MEYEKLNPLEEIQEGDIVSLEPNTNKVRLSFNRLKHLDNNVIGIVTKIEDNTILVANSGICTVNVKGIVCVGDKLTTSNTPGKAEAIKYDVLDQRQFGIRSIGKVIGNSRYYNKTKVLLDIE